MLLYIYHITIKMFSHNGCRKCLSQEETTRGNMYHTPVANHASECPYRQEDDEVTSFSFSSPVQCLACKQITTYNLLFYIWQLNRIGDPPTPNAPRVHSCPEHSRY